MIAIDTLDRVRQIQTAADTKGDIVVYWMNRDCRVHDNWALIYAQQLAIREGKSLLVVYNLVEGFLHGNGRQYMFKTEGLHDVSKELKKLNTPFLVHTHAQDDIASLIKVLKKYSIQHVVTDFSPLRVQREWLDILVKKIDVNVSLVDAHNIIPVWSTSDKLEYAAYTIRPKIHKQIATFLTEYPPLVKMPKDNMSVCKDVYEYVQESRKEIASYTKIYTGGSHQASNFWKSFLDENIERYATDRNNPLLSGQSNMSPYLHYGHISAQRMALDVIHKAKKSITSLMHSQKNGSDESDPNSYAAFLEELIVRRELADNFCWYNTEYDSVEGFPAWAKQSLHERRDDEREYVYTRTQFEQALTHDDLWNACQQEMLITGKMHGYMRMYWAKKILEWSTSAKDALATAIYLNDRYELDGRDPNGYAGIAWSIGGVHDRAWFRRPIFGLVRYMARSGVEKRCDVKKYIEKWGMGQKGLF